MPSPSPAPQLDFDACYRAASGRDRRWDGRVYLGVTSTGIYCRPSCPARKPKPENCRFFPTAAACVAAGFRACKRCRPDALPGTRHWDDRGDLVARAVRRIRDGAIDQLGVPGLAAELAVSERHMRRVLIEEVGAAPLQLARTRRAHAARALIEQTSLSLTDIAFAAGFGSVRQFGETMHAEFGVAPSELSRARNAGGGSHEADPHRTEVAQNQPGTHESSPAADTQPTLTLRLSTRAPFDARAMRAYLTVHAIPGRDVVSPTPDDRLGQTAHAVDVPGGVAVATVDWDAIPIGTPGASVGLPVTLRLPSLADTLPAIQALRRMFDLDADPLLISEAFAADQQLGALIAARPGLRLPGARHPHEFALATVLGQQVSLAAARTLQGRLITRFGASGAAGALSCSPDVTAIAAESPESLREILRITGARAATVHALASALAAGLDLGPGADREHARQALSEIRGIGPWTIEMIALRSLGDPDAFPSGDLILRRALDVDRPRDAERRAERWRPLRGYATQHLWADFLSNTSRKAAS